MARDKVAPVSVASIAKRTVVQEAMIDDAIAAPLPPAPPVRGHRAELVEPQWMKDYRAHNDKLAAAAEKLVPVWEPRERGAILRDVRAVVSRCTTKTEILAAIDLMIDGGSLYSETSDPPFKGGK